MRGRTRHRFPQTTSEPPEACGDALPDGDTDRGATLRVELVRASDCVVSDRTEATDNQYIGRPFDVAGAECARSHCRLRARSSRLAGLVALYGRTMRADLVCGVRRRTNRRHRMILDANLGDGGQSRRKVRDQA